MSTPAFAPTDGETLTKIRDVLRETSRTHAPLHAALLAQDQIARIGALALERHEDPGHELFATIKECEKVLRNDYDQNTREAVDSILHALIKEVPEALRTRKHEHPTPPMVKRLRADCHKRHKACRAATCSPKPDTVSVHSWSDSGSDSDRDDDSFRGRGRGRGRGAPGVQQLAAATPSADWACRAQHDEE